MSEEQKGPPTGASASPPRRMTKEEDEVNIAKAVRFWKHPSMKDIPMEQKRMYLYEKGVTDSQIHQAWDRILEDDKCTSELISSTVAVPGTPETRGNPTVGPQPPITYPLYSGTSPYQSAPSSYPSGMSPYPSQYSASYPPRYPEEEDGPGPLLRGLSLVALGSLVGLTAAAAARWLNGGDFEMLPPPVVPTKDAHSPNMSPIQGGRLLEGEDGEHDETEGHDYHVDSGDEEFIEGEEDIVDEQSGYGFQIPERLMDQVESIADTMKAHVSIQEKILQKLSRNGSTITNQSMELLRASSEVANTDSRFSGGTSSIAKQSSEVLQLWGELLQIKGEVQRLVQGSQRQNSQSDHDQATSLDDRIAATISKLDSCIESIQEIFAKPQSSSSAITATAVVSSSDNVSLVPPNESVQSVSTPCPSDQASTYDKLTVRQSIARMAQATDPTKLRVACQLMYLYLVNLTGAPNNSRYRKIFTGNDNFKKVEAVDGAKSLLLAVGFEESKGCLEWLPSNSSPKEEESTLGKVQEVLQALSILKTGQISPEVEAKVMTILSSDGDVPSPDSLQRSTRLEDEKPPDVCHESRMDEQSKTIDVSIEPSFVTEASTEDAEAKLQPSVDQEGATSI